jgi:MarR family 2-MHQ and catechol resistance regulon transcriptional repressor
MTNFHGSSKQVLALNTFIKLVRCTNSVSHHVHKHLQNELTVSQFSILEALFHLGPLSQKDLAVKILKSAGNITTVINNLEKAGLVVRVLNVEDKRFYSIHLTDEGRKLIERIFPIHAETVCDRMSALSEKEQQTLGALLKKLSMTTP